MTAFASVRVENTCAETRSHASVDHRHFKHENASERAFLFRVYIFFSLGEAGLVTELLFAFDDLYRFDYEELSVRVIV